MWWKFDVQIYQQIFYAYYDIEKIGENINKNSFIGIFYHLQSLLVCMGNISKLLQNSANYCVYLSINIKEIPVIMNRKLRNINEHIDEHLRGNKTISSDMGTGKNDLDEKLKLATQRFFNTAARKLQYVDKDGSVCEIEISKIEKELSYLISLEPIRYIFERYKGYDVIH